MAGWPLPDRRHPACANPHRRRERQSPRSCRSRSGACRPLEPLEPLAEARHWHLHHREPKHKHKHRPLWLPSQWPLWRASAACQTARWRQGPSTPLRGACRPIPAWHACAPRNLRCGLTVQAVSTVSARVRARPRCTCGEWTSVPAATCGPCRSASTTWPPRPASTKSRVCRGPPRRIRALLLRVLPPSAWGRWGWELHSCSRRRIQPHRRRHRCQRQPRPRQQVLELRTPRRPPRMRAAHAPKTWPMSL